MNERIKEVEGRLEKQLEEQEEMRREAEEMRERLEEAVELRRRDAESSIAREIRVMRLLRRGHRVGKPELNLSQACLSL
jgi:hypothetical protein